MLQTLKFWGKRDKPTERETQGGFQHHHSALFIKIYPADDVGRRSVPALLMQLHCGNTGAAPRADLWDEAESLLSSLLEKQKDLTGSVAQG